MDKKHTVGNVTAGLMIAVALLCDGLQFLLTLSVLLLPLSIFVTVTCVTMFFLWFALLGVKYTDHGGGKKLLTMLAASVAELVPVVNALPAVTAGVLGVIVQTRIEDARRQSGGKVTPRTAMAYARLRKMQQARTQREASAREGREEAQAARHAPAGEGPAA
jgi:hypothetical protein